MNKEAIKIINLDKTYKKGRIAVNALEDISLDIQEGEFLALQGPSGSGKTTLLNIIGGLDSPTKGSINVKNIEISSLKNKELAKWRVLNIGFIFQLYNLIPVLTAYENIELPLLLLPLSKQERKKHVLNVLDLVGLTDRKNHYPKELSGGQEQRVAIARALVTDPKIILADEPTGNLDQKNSMDIIELMAIINDKFNKIFIIVTHDPDIAQKAKRRIYLHKGKLVS